MMTLYMNIYIERERMREGEREMCISLKKNYDRPRDPN